MIHLGIKVPPAEIIAAVAEHRPDYIGLSGLLVKSAQQMVVTAEDELLIREIVVHQLVPELAEEVRLAAAFDFNTLVDWFLDQSDQDLDESVQLRATSRLEAALAERVFYSTFVAGGLAEIYATQAEILRLLGERLDEHN